MTPSNVFQPLNNVVLSTQQGDSIVAQATATFSGGDVLIGFSASGWSQAPGPVSMTLWMDGQPTGGQLAVYASQPSMHLALGHSWIWVPGVTAGQHELALVSGATTVTDLNDRACLTVWEMGDGCAVRFSYDEPCPAGTAQVLVKEAVGIMGGQCLVSGSASGFVSTAGQNIGVAVKVGSLAGGPSEVMANNANQHLATVATDLFVTKVPRGQLPVMVAAGPGVSTDATDTAHLAVVDWVNEADAPVVLEMAPALQNAQAQTQHGDGGTVAASKFQSSGGTLLVRVYVSAWTQNSGGVPLLIGIQIDGTSRGFAEVWANSATTHMPMVGNDLVVTGIPAGAHTLNLMGELNTVTDYNDRVSVLIMEFPQG